MVEVGKGFSKGREKRYQRWLRRPIIFFFFFFSYSLSFPKQLCSFLGKLCDLHFIPRGKGSPYRCNDPRGVSCAFWINLRCADTHYD